MSHFVDLWVWSVVSSGNGSMGAWNNGEYNSIFRILLCIMVDFKTSAGIFECVSKAMDFLPQK